MVCGVAVVVAAVFLVTVSRVSRRRSWEDDCFFFLGDGETLFESNWALFSVRECSFLAPSRRPRSRYCFSRGEDAHERGRHGDNEVGTETK